MSFLQGHIRALALRVLREILKNQPSRFKDYTELTILRILEAHKDSEREVVRSAEECADTLANYLPPETCVRILNPIISTALYPVNLAAIKMQNKVIVNQATPFFFFFVQNQLTMHIEFYCRLIRYCPNPISLADCQPT